MGASLPPKSLQPLESPYQWLTWQHSYKPFTSARFKAYQERPSARILPTDRWMLSPNSVNVAARAEPRRHASAIER